MISLTLTDACHQFWQLVQRVSKSGETATLTEDGKPIIQLAPAPPSATGASLARTWSATASLDPEEAALFEHDLLEARRTLPRQLSKWA